MTDPFGAPTPAGKYPAVAGLEGRLLLLIPKKVESVPDTFNVGQMRDRLVTDVVVLTGDRICRWEKVTNNGRTREPKEFDLGESPEEAGGVKLRDMWISNGPLVKACADALDPAKPVTMVLGRLATAPSQFDNDAWILTDATGTSEDVSLARAYLDRATVSPFG